MESVPTRTACRNLCLRETGFLCRSFAFLAEAGQCYLYPTNREQAGSSYARLPGFIFEEWTCDAGQCTAISFGFGKKHGVELLLTLLHTDV